MAVSSPTDLQEQIAAMSDDDLAAAFCEALLDTRVPGWYDRVLAEDRMHLLLAEAQRRDLKLLDPAAV